MEDKKTEPTERNLQEMVLYHIVSREFEADNIYGMVGRRPNAKGVASQYGVKLEFRWSKFKDRPLHTLLARREYGIADNGDCLSAVLLGEDREQLAKARDDIYKTFGVGSFKEGSISVGSEKHF